MGNQPSTTVRENHQDDTAEVAPVPTEATSVSSTSLSERSDESNDSAQEVDALDDYCSTAASACIPSVLSLRSRVNPMIDGPGEAVEEDPTVAPTGGQAAPSLPVVASRFSSLFSSSMISMDKTTTLAAEGSDDASSIVTTTARRTFGLGRRKRQFPTTDLVAPIPEYPYMQEEVDLLDGHLPTPESDLSRPRDYWIVTTAALPWMTGTAVNPLLRAAYLSEYNRKLTTKKMPPTNNTMATDTADAAPSEASEEESVQQQLTSTMREETDVAPEEDEPVQQPTATDTDAASSDDNEEELEQQQHSFDRSTVTLVLPWLESAFDREELYGPDWRDATPDEQEAYIRDWLSRSANMPLEARPACEGGIRILFYPGRYHKKLSSIFAMGDLCEWMVKTAAVDEAPERFVCPDTVCILEEPEHVHFYRAQRWKDHFCHIIGIIHTNYKAYASSPAVGGGCFSLLAGTFTGPFVASISSLLVKAYCDQVIKLSPVLQTFALEKETVCNVHGIRQDFIKEGERRAQLLQSRLEDAGSADKGDTATTAKSTTAIGGDKIYFVGKLLFAKGFDKLLELESAYRGATGEYFPIDIYGSGPEEEEIQQAFLSEQRPRFFPASSSTNSLASAAAPDATSTSDKSTLSTSSSSSSLMTRSGSRMNMASTYYSTFVRPRPPVPARFLGRRDHAELTGEYKIFVNPSITEVLCTTTAEASAMGKFVIIPEHPSNEFFAQFPNSLMYRTRSEFVSHLEFAIANNPKPLNEDSIRTLTWEAATERLVRAAAISRRDAQWRERIGKSKADEKIAQFHYELGKGAKGDVIRKVLGGGPVADQFQYDCMLESDQSVHSCASAETLEVCDS